MIIALAERRIAPDSIIRFGIRRLLRQRLAQEYAGGDLQGVEARKLDLMQQLATGPVAVAQG
ncbi:MAG: SAM-dependent methyltransferase, partial [Gammaproteobacteria bacterium HGW-Gammaproteobacteria-14]